MNWIIEVNKFYSISSDHGSLDFEFHHFFQGNIYSRGRHRTKRRKGCGGQGGRGMGGGGKKG